MKNRNLEKLNKITTILQSVGIPILTIIFFNHFLTHTDFGKNASFILDGTLKYTTITHPNKFKKNTFSHITSSLPQTIARD